IAATSALIAQSAPPPAAESAPAAPTSSAGATEAQAATNTKAAAAVASGQAESPRTPGFLEHLVDGVLEALNIRTSTNTVTHYAISAILLVIALLARRIVTHVLFPILRKVASRTRTTFDDRLFAATESPISTFIMLVGIFGALRVLKLSPSADIAISYGSRVAFSLAVFWLLWRGLQAVLDHGAEIANARQLGIAAFMPWIKKSLMTVFVVLGVLLTIQGLGYDVKAILTGLGIGGLAFALAAQDTLANIFGAIVVAVDQPFRIGETVKIQGNVGGVEDIGVRSTRIRLIDGSLMVIPNKIVAAETITNLSRFIKRRFEQVIGLTYDTRPEDMEAIVEEIRGIIKSQPEVGPNPLVFFRDLNASSLDIWIVYEIPDPDFARAMNCKQRINFLIMRAVEARGLSFAFPTQTLHLESEAIARIADRSNEPPPNAGRPPRLEQ
ncbi:MAG TPA: mechanosensitive ion channel family protein, partial [Opitutus sp.]|nr:mechanosensitive ion channel family protein [Opitutus sp.]